MMDKNPFNIEGDYLEASFVLHRTLKLGPTLILLCDKLEQEGIQYIGPIKKDAFLRGDTITRMITNHIDLCFQNKNKYIIRLFIDEEKNIRLDFITSHFLVIESIPKTRRETAIQNFVHLSSILFDTIESCYGIVSQEEFAPSITSIRLGEQHLPSDWVFYSNTLLKNVYISNLRMESSSHLQLGRILIK
jgi:hypothetical protein